MRREIFGMLPIITWDKGRGDYRYIRKVSKRMQNQVIRWEQSSDQGQFSLIKILIPVANASKGDM